jgi:hypothetical protein
MSDQNPKEGEIIVDEPKTDEDKAKLEETVESLTNEIKEIRKSRQEDREALDAVLKGADDKVTPPVNDDETTETVKKLLQAQEVQNVERYKEAALEDFKRSLPEFHPDNDTTGLAYKAFERELNKFNLSDLRDKEEFAKRFKEVHVFMNRNKSEDTAGGANPMAASPSSAGGADPSISDGNELTKKEKDLIAAQGWDKERYLKLKAKRPQYVEKLLNL